MYLHRLASIFVQLILVLFIWLVNIPTAFAQQATAWEDVPAEVRARKAFKRFEWFYRQRAMPATSIPDGAIEKARTEEMAREAFRSPQEKLLDLSWSPIGPAGVVSTYPSQWGIVSGRVRALAVHPTNPSIAYIGPAAGGIWKTTDGGATWQDVGVNLASMTFGAIAIDPSNPQNVYAGAGEAIRYFNTTTYSGKGLYKSTDGGATWSQITSGFGSTTHFGAVKVSPTSATTVFAALASGYYYGSSPGNEGLWRSTNSGVTWTRTLNVDDGFDVLPHPTTANRVYAATGGGASSAGFYRSTDNGATWTQITSGLPTSTTIQRMQIALSTGTPATLYALIYTSTGNATVYRSTNDGTNWSAVSSGYSTSQGWYDLTIAVNPTNVNEVYIGMEELRRSTDGGATFAYVGGSYWGQSMHVDFHTMAFAPSNSNYRYVGCDGGIYLSSDGGSTWTNLNATLPTIQYYRIGSHPSNQNILTGGAQDNGVFNTTNGGSGNWTLISTGDGMECFYDYTTPTTVYASTQYGAIVKSTTGGGYGSFSSIQPTTSDTWAWTAPFFIHPTTSTTIYTASQRPWRSTNGGATWTDLNGGALTTYNINTMAQSRVNANNMILAASEGSSSWPATPPVYVSTNGGTSWTSVTANIGGSARYITRVLFHPTDGNTCFVVRSGFGAGNKIYRSTNLGTSWTNISGDLPDVPHNDLFIDPSTPSEMYTANDLGVYRTTNSGTNWTRQGNGMPYVPAIDFDAFISGGTRMLRAATHGRSAYQASLGSTQSVQVTVPNGGEVWRVGASQNIQWTSFGLTGNVAIDLSRNAGSSWESIQSSTADDGIEAWTVTGPAIPTAIVRVSSVSNPSVRDSSNALFTIVQPLLTLTLPNGGEMVLPGTFFPIQWSSVNLGGNVVIALSRNNGATFDTLFAITPDDGMEVWTVTGPSTSQAIVRISSLDIPTLSDQSDNVFSIMPAVIGVSVPGGGESWSVGSSQTIAWGSTGVTGTVAIRLSRDGGATYPEVLFTGLTNDGAEPWTVTGPATTTARVRVISESDTTVMGSSISNFSITQTTVVHPVTAGWNMLSVPVEVPDLRRSQVFPGAASDAYAFTLGGYQPRDTLQYTEGYWLKYDSLQSITLAGGMRAGDTVNVVAGWNLIGSVSVVVPVDSIIQIPAGLITLPLYVFDGSSYVQADTVKPMRSYWLKATQAGQVVLRNGP